MRIEHQGKNCWERRVRLKRSTTVSRRKTLWYTRSRMYPKHMRAFAGYLMKGERIWAVNAAIVRDKSALPGVESKTRAEGRESGDCGE